MSETKQARLVRRYHNELNGGTSEIWDVGNDAGVYVDFGPMVQETMAFPFDLSKNTVTSWIGIGVWYEDATGGKAIRELGYEIEEDGHGND